jgi:hypothetical protein
MRNQNARAKIASIRSDFRSSLPIALHSDWPAARLWLQSARAGAAGFWGIGVAIIKRILTVVAFVVAAGAAFADDFPLSGNYTQNVLCKGDGTDPVAVRVKISPQEIVSNVGACTILDTTRDGETYAVRVECKFASGPLMGNLSFTPKPDRTIDFVDRDGNYKAVLHPCPN